MTSPDLPSDILARLEWLASALRLIVLAFVLLGLVAAMGELAVGDGLGALDRASGSLLLLGLWGLAVSNVWRQAFPRSQSLTPAAFRWQRWTLGSLWLGLIGQLAVPAVRWLTGTSPFLRSQALGSLSLPGLVYGVVPISYLLLIALGFRAEWERADGDQLRWPRWKNYAPDEEVYTAAGQRYRRWIRRLFRPVTAALLILGIGAAVYLIWWHAA